jgi:hypothetical protein
MLSEKERQELLDRREFTVQTALALLAGVTITVSGCGDDDDNGSPTSPTVQTDITGTVATNHTPPHTARITAAELTAGNAISLNIRGDATHPHTVELTSDEVRRIAQRQQVSKSSSTDNGHNHTVTFN